MMYSIQVKLDFFLKDHFIFKCIEDVYTISINNLNISWRIEDSSVLLPLNLYWHIPGGDSTGHLASVSLLEVSVKCERRDLGWLYCPAPNII